MMASNQFKCHLYFFTMMTLHKSFKSLMSTP